MRADWPASGACTSGSPAPPRGETRRASGGAATTSTTRADAMQMPGQTWPGAAASFLAMWVVMMVAMMLPSLVPILRRYREAFGGAGETRLGLPTVLVGLGYFFVWTAFGLAAFPLGVGLATIEMR